MWKHENVLLFKSVLDQEVTYIKGVGPSKSALLTQELNINSVRDLLLDFPIRYEDRTQYKKIAEILPTRGEIGCHLIYNPGTVNDEQCKKMLATELKFRPRQAIERDETLGADKIHRSKG